MTSDERNKFGLHVVNDSGYQQVLERLMGALDGVHHHDAELHQLYLETQWLLSNQQSGMLVLPTTWELIAFRMVHTEKLSKHPNAHQATVELINIIKKIAHCGEEQVG